MKKLLQPLKAWFTGKEAAPEEPSNAQVPATPPNVPPAQAHSAPLVQPPIPPKRQRPPEPPPAGPPKSIEAIVFNSGPEIKVVIRGAKAYAACPHCQASWNIRERISHPSFRRDGDKTLTCPACNKEVSLPVGTDLRKLS